MINITAPKKPGAKVRRYSSYHDFAIVKMLAMLQGTIFRNRPGGAGHGRCPASLVHLTGFPQGGEEIVKRVHLEEVGALRKKNGFQEYP